MKRTLVLVAGAVMVAGSAWAVPMNVRPATGPTNLNRLQNWMDGNAWVADAEADQSSAAIFGVAPTSSDALFTMVFETSNGTKSVNNRFGLYNYGDASSLFELFPGPAADPGSVLPDGATVLGTKSTVSFYSGAAHVNTVSDVKYSDGTYGSVDYLDTWYAGVNSNAFGFYLDSTGTQYNNGGLFFSEDDLNDGGLAQALIYQGIGGNDGEWLIAFEHGDRSIFSDSDFDDMIVVAQSINPVPEPATMVLLGSGLVGLAGMGRRKKNKKS